MFLSVHTRLSLHRLSMVSLFSSVGSLLDLCLYTPEIQLYTQGLSGLSYDQVNPAALFMVSALFIATY
jgi:hypothetical protein